MAHDPHAATPANVPPELLAQHRTTWHFFTRMLVWNAVGTAIVLVFLLLVGKVF
jgi:hypothetical protein